MRLRLAGAAVLACVLALAGSAADARHAAKHPRHDSAVATGCVLTNAGRKICSGGETRVTGRARVAMARSGRGGTVVGGRPRGCPYAFCGCEASLYLFGRIIPSLNLAANWIRKFPRTLPAPGMAAARNHHVMVLVRHVSGKDWLVHDGNSGNHLTHEHVRSIAGYVIVDPKMRTAMR